MEPAHSETGDCRVEPPASILVAPLSMSHLVPLLEFNHDGRTTLLCGAGHAGPRPFMTIRSPALRPIKRCVIKAFGLATNQHYFGAAGESLLRGKSEGARPTTHFVSASQAILFRGGIDMIRHQMPALLAIAAAFFTIALLRFRKPSFKRRDGFL